MPIRTIIRLLMVGAALEAVPADAQTFPPLGAGEASRALTARALLFPDIVTFSRIPASTRSGNVAVAPRLSAFTEPFPFPSNPAADLNASRAAPAGATLTTSSHGRQSFQRAFADFRQEQQEKDPVLKYVGVGMMVVGGLNFLYGSAACASNGVGGRCVPYVVVSGGIGVGGWFLYKRHR